jgi:hypothetical protein
VVDTATQTWITTMKESDHIAISLLSWRCPVCVTPVSELPVSVKVRVLCCGHLLCDTCHMALVKQGTLCSTLVVSLNQSAFGQIRSDNQVLNDTSVAYACPLCQVISVAVSVPSIRIN